VATIRLTQKPYKEPTSSAPAADYEAEGFAYLESIGADVDGVRPSVLWRSWKLYSAEMWVVRFEVVGPHHA
jgi:hypothetical protein